MVLFVMTGSPTAMWMPPPRSWCGGPTSVLPVMMLFWIVGELKMKMPPPEVSSVSTIPSPPVIVNPSSNVLGVCPEAKITVLHCTGMSGFFMQNLSSAVQLGSSHPVQGCPAPLMIVARGPFCEIRSTFGFIRIDSG